MLLKPAAAQAVSEVSKKKPGPRPGGASTAGGTAQSGQPRAVLPPCPSQQPAPNPGPLGPRPSAQFPIASPLRPGGAQRLVAPLPSG